MHQDDFPTPGWKERFPEPIKFLPVIFILGIIGGLYWIYLTCHLLPRLQESKTTTTAAWEFAAFHAVTLMLLVCYFLSVFVHPGTIPDKEEDPSWEYDGSEDPQPIAVDTALHIRQEQKRSGERRKCKWCLKYKPDRTHHCRVCRMCILKMDHHCPWIYNCVGFRNYKYFFLLLVYTNIDCVLVVSTMLPSVRAGTQPTTPFMTMFLLIFGETLAGFLCVLVTMFLGFHIYLMLQAMTTIEFCEKSTRGGFRASIYDRGFVGNICAVLGDNPLLWMLPMAPPKGRGLTFVTEDTRLTQDMEAGRGLRRRAHEAKEAAHIAPKRRTDRPFSTGGTGSTGQSEEDSQSGSGSEEVPRAVADVGSSRDRPARASASETGSYGATAVGETGAPADVVAASSGGTSPLLSPTGGDKPPS